MNEVRKNELKKAFETIISLTSDSRYFNSILKQIKLINGIITELENRNQNMQAKINGVKPEYYNDVLSLYIDIMKLLGFTEENVEWFNQKFITWMHYNIPLNYKAKKMNYNLLLNIRLTWMMCIAENEGKEPTFEQLKKRMLEIDKQNQNG